MTEGFNYILFAKGFRTFVSGMASVMTPIYLALLGYNSVQVGIGIMVIVMGNVFSNILLTWYGNALGRRTSLLTFSTTMVISGMVVYLSSNFALLLLGLFIGNISTTGTEAGPFQSIETGIIPRMVVKERLNRAFGLYNLVGYAASSVGAFASSIPAYLGNQIEMIRSMFLLLTVAGLLLFIIYRRLKDSEIESSSSRRPGLGSLSSNARRDISKLSLLFSVDAFGGSLVSQSILSYWFFIEYKADLSSLGVIFLFANIITAFSTYGAALIANRIGNLKTMVYTHIISNFFLIMVPIAGSLLASVLFLFLRQSLSQMDVPTRQAFLAEIFRDEERVVANSVTNTARSISSIFGAPLAGLLFGEGLLSAPILVGGLTKISFDLAIFSAYRNRSQ